MKSKQEHKSVKAAQNKIKFFEAIFLCLYASVVQGIYKLSWIE